MKNFALTSFIALLGLSSCGSLSAGTQATKITAQATSISTINLLAKGRLLCPPDAKHPTWWDCGGFRLLRAGPGMGGDIIPADLIVDGSKSAYAGLGDSVQASLPSSGYTKFAVGKLIFTVEDLDQTLFNSGLSAKFQSAQQLQDGSYQFNYSGELSLKLK